jgi:hypothetical protein
MTLTSPTLELGVLGNGDVIRAERTARSLRAELADIDGVEVRFATNAMSAQIGAKSGTAVATTTLWAFLGVATEATARIVLATIRAWVEKERNRAVRITVGDRLIEIPGSPDEAQERIIAKILESGRS